MSSPTGSARRRPTSPAFGSSARFVEWIHDTHGTVHVFLTGFVPVWPADTEGNTHLGEKVRQILDRGVDGIMTDRPARVRQIVDAWIADRWGIQPPWRLDASCK